VRRIVSRPGKLGLVQALPLARVCEAVCAWYGIDRSELARPGSRYRARAALAYLARRRTPATHAELMAILGVSREAVWCVVSVRRRNSRAVAPIGGTAGSTRPDRKNEKLAPNPRPPRGRREPFAIIPASHATSNPIKSSIPATSGLMGSSQTAWRGLDTTYIKLRWAVVSP
jgi:hypothetical protein